MPRPVSEAAPAVVGALRVLIVDDEVNVRFAIERRLRKEGFATAAASTVRHAIDRLRNDAYDVVLCDLRMPGGGGEQLLRWLGAHTPSTRAIVVSAFITDAFKATFKPSDNLRHVEKPVDLDKLVEMIHELGPRRGFFGNSIEVELFDYVQMIALTGRDKVIEVITPRATGTCWFEHGDVVHCEYGEFRGEMAFYRIISANRGTFQEVYWSDPPKVTVMRSSTHLLMEAARMADEGKLAELDVPPTHEVTETPLGDATPVAVEDETSFESLNTESEAIVIDEEEEVEEVEAPEEAPASKPPPPPPPIVKGPAPAPEQPVDDFDEVIAAATAAAVEEVPKEGSGTVAAGGGHAIFEDPDTRQVMLEQFWQFGGINGVAIISSTGKVLAEDMRSNGSMVTLAGFYMRGAARLARTLGYNVFDGVVARSMNGQQMVMVGMGAASAVLSVEPDHDPEAVRDAVMGVE